MARGDFIDTTYRTGVGTETKRVQARSAGATVQVDIPKLPNDPFVIVTEVNKVGAAVSTSRFAKSEVVAIIEGNAPVAAAKRAK